MASPASPTAWLPHRLLGAVAGLLERGPHKKLKRVLLVDSQVRVRDEEHLRLDELLGARAAGRRGRRELERDREALGERDSRELLLPETDTEGLPDAAGEAVAEAAEEAR